MAYVAIFMLIFVLVLFIGVVVQCILSAKRYQESTERVIEAYQKCIDNWDADNETITENDKEKEDGANS